MTRIASRSLALMAALFITLLTMQQVVTVPQPAATASQQLA